MMQNLRQSPCDSRCPDMYEVPVTAGNVLAIAHSCFKTGDVAKAECVANAHLIAASPDMFGALTLALEQLKAYRVDMDTYCEDHGTSLEELGAEEVDEAIAKAESALKKANGEWPVNDKELEKERGRWLLLPALL
jgi:hypothetical protein